VKSIQLSGSILLFVLCLSGVPALSGSTIAAASCSQTHVQAAINNASSGDTVVVPACPSTSWTTTASGNPSIIINKALTLQGQTLCSGRASTLSCTDNTVIYDGTGTGDAEVPIYVNSNNVRVSGFTIIGGNSGDYKSFVFIAPDKINWRIDHCRLAPTSTSIRGIVASGYGLIDHCYIQNANNGVAPQGDSVLDSVMAGDHNWSTPLNLGSSEAVYMEDNKFVYSSYMDGAFDSYNGAKLVFRYNDVTGTGHGGHGLDSSGTRSTLLMEIYNNVYGNPNSNIWEWSGARGGTYLIFNETITGNYDTFFDLRNYRTDNGFGYGNGAACGGSNYIDQNSSNGHGYACRDQVGRGPETNPSNDWPIKTTTAIFSEALMPGYSWNNKFKGSAPAINDFNISDSSNNSMPNNTSLYHILNNRDFYNEVAGFNGTSGVGSGLLSARPSTCTPNVAYWATDTSTLYQCSGANSWTQYYKPYIYPHPLQGVTPPTNLRILQ
jgi:hypothetical protein